MENKNVMNSSGCRETKSSNLNKQKCRELTIKPMTDTGENGDTDEL